MKRPWLLRGAIRGFAAGLPVPIGASVAVAGDRYGWIGLVPALVLGLVLFVAIYWAFWWVTDVPWNGWSDCCATCDGLGHLFVGRTCHVCVACRGRGRRFRWF